jgi:glucoamylase
VRIGSGDVADAGSPCFGFVPIKNRTPDQSSAQASALISPDALALVRFGLRAANDPRILDTIRVIDATLKTETTTGPVWYRYNQDGYGEHEDGAPFDGTGIGRGWPLLAGERAHYEIARGDLAAAEKLLRVIEAQTSPGGFIPEQVWEAQDIPALELYNGRPSGSAMPLMWAHAEYIKLLRSLRDGRVFDMPPQTVQRYLVDGVTIRFAVWRFNQKCASIPAGFTLRIEVGAPAIIVWTIDNWKSQESNPANATRLQINYFDIETGNMQAGSEIEFTFRWPNGQWEGQNFKVSVV